MRPRSSGLRSHATRLAVALGLFAAIFVLRAVDDDPASGVAVLYVLPVVIIAIAFGWLAGVAAGVGALTLLIAWTQLEGGQLSLWGHLTRGAVYILVGVVAGHMAEGMARAQRKLEASARHFELSRDLLCTASFDGRLLHLNGSWQALLGWSAEELTSRPFIEFVHPDDRERTLREAQLAAQVGRAARFTNRYSAKDGTWRWIEWSSEADPAEQVIYAAARDVTARYEAEEELRYLADHDPLSGLYNTRRFRQELERELAHAGNRGSQAAVLLFDVDRFKAINDGLGHAVGDAVISAIGEALRDRLRTTDVPARIGGDEFAALLRRVSLAEAESVADDVRQLITARLGTIVGTSFGPIGVSIGIAELDGIASADDVLRVADRAMYGAKAEGGARVRVGGAVSGRERPDGWNEPEPGLDP